MVHGSVTNVCQIRHQDYGLCARPAASRIRASMRAESPLYTPRSRDAPPYALAPRDRWSRSVLAAAVLALLVGLAFAGSSQRARVGNARRRGRRRRPDEARGDRQARRALRAALRAARRVRRVDRGVLVRAEPARGRSPTGAPPSTPPRAPVTASARSEAFAAFARASSAPRCCRSSRSRTRRSSTCSTRSPTDVDRRPRSAALVRRGLRISVVPEQAGSRLDREAAAEVVVRALGQLERTPGATALPVRVTAPPVTAEMLAGRGASAHASRSRRP